MIHIIHINICYMYKKLFNKINNICICIIYGFGLMYSMLYVVQFTYNGEVDDDNIEEAENINLNYMRYEDSI